MLRWPRPELHVYTEHVGGEWGGGDPPVENYEIIPEVKEKASEASQERPQSTTVISGTHLDRQLEESAGLSIKINAHGAAVKARAC